jgi:hypothetical protein
MLLDYRANFYPLIESNGFFPDILKYETTTTTTQEISTVGLMGIFTAFFAKLPKVGLLQTSGNKDVGIVVHEDEGIHILTRRKVPISIKISKARHGINGISFCREIMKPGAKMRVHKHLNNDELILFTGGKAPLF